MYCPDAPMNTTGYIANEFKLSYHSLQQLTKLQSLMILQKITGSESDTRETNSSGEEISDNELDVLSSCNIHPIPTIDALLGGSLYSSSSSVAAADACYKAGNRCGGNTSLSTLSCTTSGLLSRSHSLTSSLDSCL